jgi:hypothetical protein
LFGWLREADNFPTVQKYWIKHGKLVLDLPEYVCTIDEVLPYHVAKKVTFPNTSETEFAMAIRQQISNYFEDIVSARQIRFKDFSNIPNTRRFVSLQPIPGYTNTWFFIVDVRLLTLEKVHSDFKKIDPSFHCHGVKCGCIQNILIEDILALMPSQQKSALDCKFRKKYLDSLPTNLNTSAPEPQDDFLIDESNLPLPPNIAQTNSNIGMQQNSVKNQNGNSKGDTKHQVNPSTSDTEKRDELHRIDRQSLSNLATTTNNVAHACFQRCATAAPIMESTFISQTQVDSKSSTPIENDGNADIVPGTFRHIHSVGNMKVYMHNESIPAISGYEALSMGREVIHFSALLNRIVRDVFHYPLDRVAIFIGATSTIAFNRQGQIFFNVMAMESYIPHKSPLAAFDLMYNIFCHELAHNVQSQHNAEFAAVLGDVSTHCMDAYAACRMQLQSKLHAIPDGFAMWEVCNT